MKCSLIPMEGRRIFKILKRFYHQRLIKFGIFGTPPLGNSDKYEIIFIFRKRCSIVEFWVKKNRLSSVQIAQFICLVPCANGQHMGHELFKFRLGFHFNSISEEGQTPHLTFRWHLLDVVHHYRFKPCNSPIKPTTTTMHERNENMLKPLIHLWLS